MSSIQAYTQSKLKSVTDLYYQQVKEAERNWIKDNEKSTKIQAFYRMFRYHKYYKRNRQAAIIIQKHIRACLARNKFLRQRTSKVNKENIKYFSFQAAVIQRYYRGYIKRKYFHDFYARKQYLNFLKTKNQEFKADLDRTAVKEQQEERARVEQCARTEFQKLASNLHHLASTAAQPGIYRPPFAPVPPKVFDVEVETHIKAAFKGNYQWRPPKSALQARSNSAIKPGYRIRSGSNRMK